VDDAWDIVTLQYSLLGSIICLISVVSLVPYYLRHVYWALQAQGEDAQMKPEFEATLQYAEKFALFKSKESMDEIKL
jgi:hypothetical protein